MALGINGNQVSSFIECDVCLNSRNRRGVKFLTRCFYVTLSLWIFGSLLLMVVKEDNTAIKKQTEKKEKQRNVFEQFNKLRPTEGNDYEATKNLNIPDHRNKTHHVNNFEEFRIEPNPLLPYLDCKGILEGRDEAIVAAKLKSLELKSKPFEDRRNRFENFGESLIQLADNCTQFKRERNYVTSALTTEESNYPIAYILTVHTNIAALERLLRAIYRPQNIYCVHVDRKSSQEFQASVRKISGCFQNVFVPSNLTEVHYTHWSRVQADLNCMHNLIDRKQQVQWRYVINLCGAEFPLKTNFELVRSLKNLYGYNSMESVIPPPHKTKRYEYHFVLPDTQGDYVVMGKTNIKKEPSPLDIPMFIGSAYYVLKRQAVEFIMTDSEVQKFFKWNKDTYSPDEHMWATLQRYYPRLPGSFPPHVKYDQNELQTITKLVKWGGLDTLVYPKCSGIYSRGICMLGVGDLSWLLQQHHLFANKFDSHIDPYAIECLDILLRNKTISQAVKYNSVGFI
ncbi:beta-1,3-galactosyl-O-glycosyl-glycoprotein beta-1,6-N-acetylglucosaminyltransferase 3-like [Ciona intestinalis]